MAAKDDSHSAELRVSLEQSLVVQGDEADDYQDNYVRRVSGSIRLMSGEPESETEIGRVELISFDGSRAVDNGLDIVDVADSVGQDEYEYARAVYAAGVLDREIVGEAMSNDLIVVHELSILPEHRKHGYGLRVVRKIAETVGYHCGAVVLRPGNVVDVESTPDLAAEQEPPYGFRPTRNPAILCLTQF